MTNRIPLDYTDPGSLTEARRRMKILQRDIEEMSADLAIREIELEQKSPISIAEGVEHKRWKHRIVLARKYKVQHIAMLREWIQQNVLNDEEEMIQRLLRIIGESGVCPPEEDLAFLHEVKRRYGRKSIDPRE